jgi:hypothetical protein
LRHGGELDRLDAQHPAPTRLIPEAILERLLGVLIAEVDVDRFGIAGLNERVKAHGVGQYSASRG